MRLSTRFAICLAALVTALMLPTGMIVLGVVSHDLRAERDRQLVLRSRALEPMAASYSFRVLLAPAVPPDFLEQRLTGAALESGGPGGVHLEVPGAAPLVVGDVPAVMPPADQDGPATFTRDGRRWRFVAAALGRRGNLARLRVFESEERLDRQLDLLRERLVLITLAAAGTGAVAGLLLGRFAVRPLTALRAQARRIDVPSPGAARLATSSGVTEIDELAGRLNDLLDRRDAAVRRTGEALETARSFAASVAHELRTPLTSMGIDLTLLGRPDLDPAERAEIVTDLGAEHVRAQRLITMLRRLADGELADPAAFTEADLTEIVAVAVEEARRRHPHAEIAFSRTDGLPVRGWAEGLRMIADNLLDNAAVHGAGDDGRATVEVTLSAGGGTAVLAVRDAGAGIPEAEHESVFTRFHRRPGSPGSGLGLTLVRQQALLHGGTVSVTDPGRGPGTRVEVRLPAAGRTTGA
ncbi:sensor histidine kinase [Planobispora siamensis]|uniref:histidine kinase n=1 Tax=Planobispora siamensis TaxID=936338 RepID=A0A8J3WN73_9ACTN|nr:HAMP domain-containing sensor histidine kinase [Planobispora siamensis]GIH95480.1 two-component sensor histidine kinase [Planobispora siamensis]